jgi:predicted cobalt transporter CbtA
MLQGRDTMHSKLLPEGEMAAEAKVHSDWLNWIFAVSTATMAITALQFQHPWRVALLGLVVVVPMYFFAFVSFPASLRALREICQDTKDSEATKLLKYYESKYFGWSALYRNAGLWLALALYVTVLFSRTEPCSKVLWFAA